MRDPGMAHVRASRSISSHRAPRASPDRAAVSTRNRKHSLEGEPRLSTPLSSPEYVGYVLIGQGSEVGRDCWRSGQARVNHLSRWVQVDVVGCHGGREDLSDALPQLAGK